MPRISRLFTYPLRSAFDVQGRLSSSHVAVLPLMSFYGVPAYNKGNKIKFGGEDRIMQESGPLCSQQEEEAQ